MFAAAFAFLRIDTDEMVGGGDVYPLEVRCRCVVWRRVADVPQGECNGQIYRRVMLCLMATVVCVLRWRGANV